MEGYANFVIAKRKMIIALVALVTAFFAFTLLELRVNSSPYFMAQEHESRIHELDIKRLFTNSGEQILVALEPANGSPLDLETVTQVKKLTTEFEALTLNEFIDELVLTKLRISAESSALVDQLVTAPVNKRLDIARQLESLAKSSGADTKAFRKSLDKV
ncbi:hypothetical protein, partial [Oleiphilus sp. HI0132]|uniref:hypothetical protein n=1 Tax=Oleiphilus sp. HI0132 TaxID=1822270 RepID=UPI000B05F00B